MIGTKLGNYGLTSAYIKNGSLIVEHRGNMGNAKENSVIPNAVKILNGNPFEMYKLIGEAGFPDYLHKATFDMGIA